MIRRYRLEQYLCLAASIIIAALSFCIMLHYFRVPMVHYSVVDGACVRVVPHSAGTCESLPDSYDYKFVLDAKP